MNSRSIPTKKPPVPWWAIAPAKPVPRRLAQQMASRRVSLASMSGQASEGELKELNLILKADVQGSVEAILGSLEQLPQEEVQVRVLLSAPGEVTETDVDLAAASGAVIVGFNTSMAPGAKRAADATGVDVRDYDVIYKLLEDIQMAMEGLLEPELVEESLGEAEVRAVFSIGKSAVAGCYVTNGKLQRNCKVRVLAGQGNGVRGRPRFPAPQQGRPEGGGHRLRVRHRLPIASPPGRRAIGWRPTNW
jgi:translation initiation factor IF-2